MHKCGTTSLHRLFLNAGLRSIHNTHWSRSPIPNEYLRRHTAFSDGGGHFWDDRYEFGSNHEVRLLDEAFPGSKFILQTREVTSWVVSKMLHAGWAPDSELIETSEDLAHGEWKIKSYQALRGWIKNRYKYHETVLEYFAKRPNDLLVIDITREPDAVRKLGSFAFRQGRMQFFLDRLNRYHRLLNRAFPGTFIPIKMPHANTALLNPEPKEYCRAIAKQVLSEMDPQYEQEAWKTRLAHAA